VRLIFTGLINIFGDFLGNLCSQAFEGHLRRGKGASVVNVASAAGLTSTGTGAVYAMTKAAMVRNCGVLPAENTKLNS